MTEQIALGKCVNNAVVGAFVGAAVGLIAMVIYGVWLLLSLPPAQFSSETLIAWRVGQFFTIAGAIVGFLRSFIEEQERLAETRRRLQEAANKDKLDRQAKQQSLCTELVTVSAEPIQHFEFMPKCLLKAEELLDQAEQDFNEGAFSPFWSSIEHATMQLGAFDANMQKIRGYFQRYIDAKKLYMGRPPQFPIAMDSLHAMAAANTTSARMKSIVRTAQRNFQFATIYEQRKTNQLLIAGFTNLAQALDGMGQRIASSIDDLGGQISAMSSAMEESLSNIGEQMQTANQDIIDNIAALNATTQRNASDLKERHDRALEMLDNIQRRRKPYPRKPSDGAY